MIFSVHRHPTYFLCSLTEWVQRFCAQVGRGESVNYFAYLFPAAIVFFLKNRLSFLENYEKRGNASDCSQVELNLNAVPVLFQPDYFLSYFRLGFAYHRSFCINNDSPFLLLPISGTYSHSRAHPPACCVCLSQSQSIGVRPNLRIKDNGQVTVSLLSSLYYRGTALVYEARSFSEA